VLAAQLQHRHTAFGLAQDRKNLGSLYLVIFIKISSCILAEKILLPHPLSFFGGGLPRDVAYLALNAWRDGLSLEMWKTFRYEIDPEPYRCLSKQYRMLENLIDQAASTTHPGIKMAMDIDLLTTFNQEYSLIFAKCKYFSTL
jgi:hypothetical protein